MNARYCSNVRPDANRSGVTTLSCPLCHRHSSRLLVEWRRIALASGYPPEPTAAVSWRDTRRA